MNYLDNPLYPKGTILYLVETDNFQLTPEGFLCDAPSCDECPGYERDIFCRIFKKDVPSRQTIAKLVVTEYPEYFI